MSRGISRSDWFTLLFEFPQLANNVAFHVWSHSTVRRVSFWAASFALRVPTSFSSSQSVSDLALVPLESDPTSALLGLTFPPGPHFRDYSLCSGNLRLPIPGTVIAQHGPTFHQQFPAHGHDCNLLTRLLTPAQSLIGLTHPGIVSQPGPSHFHQ